MHYNRVVDEAVKNILLRRTVYNYHINRRGFIKACWIKFERWQDRVRIYKQRHRETMMQRRYFPSGMYITPEKPEDALPPKHILDQTKQDRGEFGYDLMAAHWLLRYIDWSPANVARYRRYQDMISRQYDQRFLPERHLLLGADLAAAHFLLHRGGAVKFVGDDTWHKQNEDGEYTLPGTRVPGMYIEAIDASGTELMFEGLDNLVDLHKLRYLNLANCKYINDWCMGKMTQFEKSLEFLDLSNCHNITANGLSGLACLKKLRFLRLEGLDKAKDMAKVVIQLEEAISDLEIVGLEYDAALESLQREYDLLSHENVVQDARGNMYAKDETGELYYLYGDVAERHVLDDDDEMPLLVNNIRKDPPALPLHTLNELDALSNGKLKHLLAGSPSGEWTQETERVLQVDSKRLLKKGHLVHPFLLPTDKGGIKKQLAKLEARERQGFLEEEELLKLNAGPG